MDHDGIGEIYKERRDERQDDECEQGWTVAFGDGRHNCDGCRGRAKGKPGEACSKYGTLIVASHRAKKDHENKPDSHHDLQPKDCKDRAARFAFKMKTRPWRSVTLHCL